MTADSPVAPVAEPARPGVRFLRRALPTLVGVVLAALATLLLHASGATREIEGSLVVMGFDEDRAVLITALLGGAIAAVCVALVAGHPAAGVAAGVGATAALFGRVFLDETQLALAARGSGGTFDPGGWALSVLTLLVAAAVAAWAAGLVAAAVRRSVVGAAVLVRVALGERRVSGRTVAAPASVVLIALALAICVPVLGDMLNYDPDVHMRQGGGPVMGLNGGAVGAGASLTPTASPPAPSAAPSGPGSSRLAGFPADLVAGPLAGSLITPGAVSASRPWSSSAPSGRGRVVGADLPAPWTGGTSSTIHIDVYLPPGYDARNARYPTLYLFPYGLILWQGGANITAMLDGLITGGTIPPEIAVFVTEDGGPYRDAECANSYDGREQFDTFVATTLVSYVDTTYRTIARAGARTLMGSSQGGYCAAALWSHHPDVFGQSVAFSGYYVSGLDSPQTINAGIPFGRNAAYMAAQSPTNVVPALPAAQRSASFVVLLADPANPFFGPQIRQFARILAAAGVPLAVIDAPHGHSWQSQRDLTPAVLELVAGRMAQTGVLTAG